ncbi:MAG: hypothetical protein R3335_03315 [Anaerolineales bacterium]|nr:hypothetical protein [Anaerolineales bacterium]
MDRPNTNEQSDLDKIIATAERMGVEIDEAEALQWLTAMSARQDDDEISYDLESGVFGHKVVMLDFQARDLARFRQIGRLVEFEDRPGVVETALALSGSAAQSKIQTYPGDADFFERVNIKAPTQEQACLVLADLIREKALSTAKGPTYQLIEVKFGSYPSDVSVGGKHKYAGSPISWTVGAVQDGYIKAVEPDGGEIQIKWLDVALDPGWCKLDWVVTDPERGTLANASNMLDVTWEAPDGSITPLDGYLDPYFQEVYLEGESIPIFAKLAKHVSANALDDYVEQLEKEVNKYLTKDINYGKAAKRMYNVFRMTGRYEEAAFLRELFDEPTAMLYQVWALIRTIDDCTAPGSNIPIETVLSQADQLTTAVIDVLEGDQEAEVVERLLYLRHSLENQETGQQLSAESERARQQVINIVNNFFQDKLTAMPTIREYIEEIQHM